MTATPENQSLQQKLNGDNASWEQLGGPGSAVQSDAASDFGASQVPTNYRNKGDSYIDTADFEVKREPGKLD